MKSSYKPLGNYIRQVKLKNSDLSLTEPMGINISKFFMPSVANTIGTDLTNYRVVKNGQFAYNPMHVGRDEVLPIALLRGKTNVIISPAYIVFEIIDKNVLNPEYLMMWFRRKDFDREAWFTTDNSVRGGFSWESFCEMKLPIPSPERQQQIIQEYNTVIHRITLNEELNEKLEETAQALYKHWFIDFEFPMTKEYAEAIGKPELKGKPYKASGGDMDYNHDLEFEIPKIWTSGILLDLMELQRGFDLPKRLRKEGQYPIYAANGITDYHFKAMVSGPGVVTGRSGSLGEVFFIRNEFWPLNTSLWIKKYNNSNPIFAYYVLKSINLLEYNGGSAVPTLNRNHLHRHSVVIPSQEIIKSFSNKIDKLHRHIEILNMEFETLKEFKGLLLNRLSLISDNFLKSSLNEVY